MAVDTAQHAITVVISPDRCEARLVFAPGRAGAMVTVDDCIAALEHQNVRIDETVQGSVESAVHSDHDAQEGRSLVVATGQAPEHGEDARIEWLVDREEPEEEGTADANGGICHYSKSAFILVRVDDVVARMHPPTEGVDGVDVCGEAIAARHGKPLELELDENLAWDAEGQLIAKSQGVLKRDHGRVAISPRIEVAEYVDFSTGHIDFNGDVVIKKGVRDRFKVQASGNIEVDGMIEAAFLESGGDLISRGGFAGREQGHARVGRNLVARYLDNVEAVIGKNLLFEREIINCQLKVRGEVTGPHGAIIGGRLLAGGAIQVAVIGSPAGVPTDLVLGSVPWLEPIYEELGALLNQSRERLDTLMTERKRIMLAIKNRRATSVDREFLSEVDFEIGPISETLHRTESVREVLRQRIVKRRRVSLTILKRLNIGVTLHYDGRAFRIQQECRGPLKIGARGRELLIVQGDANPARLSDICDVQASRR
ncbi:MAG: DUF342 domain-containing protein [Phycisphaeraceae bacterium]|nr:DUF342 domain-containing protein [Phycisphaeraceae bacterium]